MPAGAALHARDLRLASGRTEILRDVDLDVIPGRRIGLVGPNGVGKSTLLRILGGQVRPERGTVSTAPADATVGYLPQDRERGLRARS
jgi:ATPase subunit of ABC transporter with duplicated ATPase domains